jgi:mRNA interferase RelE/StbE
MTFSIRLTRSAEEDLAFYPINQQRIIVDSIRIHLTHDADKETRRRKRLTEHPLAAWELRVGDFRVFYEIEDAVGVKITAIGHKDHNDLFIRGKKVEL